MKDNGFTLVELLVTIAIAAILAAIIFPAMAGALEKARQVTCLSNERQIAISIRVYLGDYDGIFPVSQYFPPGGADLAVRDGTIRHRGCYWWSDAVLPYIGSRELLFCPDDPRTTCRESYAIVAPPFYCEKYPNGFAESRLEQPSEGLMLVETGMWCPFLGDWHASCYWSGVESLASQRAFMPERHNGGQNMAFSDGHVKWMKVAETKERSVGRDMWEVPFGRKPYYPF